MSLRDEQQNELTRIYDRRLLEDRHEFAEREARIYAAYPRLKELHLQLAENAARRARARILNRPDLLADLEDTSDSLKDEQAYILRHAGISESDLEMHYQCDDCKDTGFIENVPCHCYRQLSVELLYDKSHMKDALMRDDFSKVSMDFYSLEESEDGLSYHDYMNSQIRRIREYADNFDTEGGSLLFTGPTGTGKTFFSNCIAKQLISSGHFVVYFSAGDFFDQLARSTFGRDEEEQDRLHSYITESDLLIIDDLGTEIVNNFTVPQLFQCLNARLNSNKSTIISTNLDPQALSEIYTERVGSRIISNFDVISFYGDDIRIENKFYSGGFHG